MLPYSPGVYTQMERLLPLLPTDTDKLYLGLSMYAGLRQGEIVALRWEDVDFDLGFIRVRRAIQYAAKNVGTIKPPKTDNGVRDIPMMGQLRAILEALRKDEGLIYHLRAARSRQGPSNDPTDGQEHGHPREQVLC